MMMLLDCSPAKAAICSRGYDYEFGQLVTPGSNHAIWDGPFACDNYFFSDPDVEGWLRWLGKIEACGRRPLFMALPDVPFSARRTLELFEIFKLRTNEFPRALVLQDGIEGVAIPWNDIDAVFVGGSDQFKFSPEAIRAFTTAKILGKHVHFGRVNAPERMMNLIELNNEYKKKRKKDEDLIDSFDGSGPLRFPHMFEPLLRTARGEHPQQALIA